MVTLPNLTGEPSAQKTWSVPAEALGRPDTGSDAAAIADAAQQPSARRAKAASRRPRAPSTSRQSAVGHVKPEPPAAVPPGPQSAARSTRSRKRAR